MLAQVFGIQKLDFTTDKGEHVAGTNLYVGYANDSVEGLELNKFFLREGFYLPKDLKPNDKVNLSFNYKGRIEAVSKVNS